MCHHQGYTTDHGLPPSVDGLGLGNSNHRASSLGSGSGANSGGHHDPGVNIGGHPPDPGVTEVTGGPPSEQQAVIAIEKAYAKPVAFSVRTNVMYDGTLDDDSPVHGCAVRSVGRHKMYKINPLLFSVLKLEIFFTYSKSMMVIGGLGAR